MNNGNMSLYERVGGEEAIVKLVNAFYLRVFQDDSLVDFFDNVQVDRLKKMQKEFFTIALGGPSDYSDMNLAHAHQGRKINTQHFHAFSNHMFDTLADFNLTDDECYQVISKINTFVDDIVESSESGID